MIGKAFLWYLIGLHGCPGGLVVLFGCYASFFIDIVFSRAAPCQRSASYVHVVSTGNLKYDFPEIVCFVDNLIYLPFPVVSLANLIESMYVFEMMHFVCYLY